MVQLPHHGALTSSLRGFIGATGPTYCINSCGFKTENQFRAIHDTLKGYQVIHTAKSGAIIVRCSQPGEIQFRTYCNDGLAGD